MNTNISHMFETTKQTNIKTWKLVWCKLLMFYLIFNLCFSTLDKHLYNIKGFQHLYIFEKCGHNNPYSFTIYLTKMTVEILHVNSSISQSLELKDESPPRCPPSLRVRRVTAAASVGSAVDNCCCITCVRASSRATGALLRSLNHGPQQ